MLYMSLATSFLVISKHKLVKIYPNLTVTDMPRDLVVSMDSVQLLEGTTASDSVLCSASGYPEPEVTWSFAGEVVAAQPQLEFQDPVDRSVSILWQHFTYFCLENNQWGGAKRFLTGSESCPILVIGIYYP
jgi:hypothetical protein